MTHTDIAWEAAMSMMSVAARRRLPYQVARPPGQNVLTKVLTNSPCRQQPAMLHVDEPLQRVQQGQIGDGPNHDAALAQQALVDAANRGQQRHRRVAGVALLLEGVAKGERERVRLSKGKCRALGPGKKLN